MPTTIYNTTTVPTFSYDDVNSSLGPATGISFSTLATTVSLNRVGIYVFRAILTSNGTAKVSLVANDPTFVSPPTGPPNYGTGVNGIAPGALITDLGSINDTALTPGYQIFHFPSDHPLSPSTRYWIMLTDISIPGQATGIGFGWIDYTTESANAIGVVGEYFWTGNSIPPSNYGTFPNTSEGPYQVQVDVNP